MTVKKIGKMRTIVIQWLMAFAMLLSATHALGSQKIEGCNSNRAQCIVVSRELITGDRIGIFADNGKIVAHGRVTKMAGSRRVVAISQEYSEVAPGQKVRLLTGGSDPASIEKNYSIQSSRGRKLIEGTLATGSYSIGPGAAAMEYGGGWILRSWQDIELTARGTFTNVNGEVAQYYVLRDYLGRESRGVDVQAFGANIFSGLAGAGYTVFRSRRISFRAEANAGLAYVAGVIGDSAMTKNSGYPTKLHDGFGLITKGTASAILNLSTWHVGISLGLTNVQDAESSNVGLSLAKSID